jgi:hypothetical protein
MEDWRTFHYALYNLIWIPFIFRIEFVLDQMYLFFSQHWTDWSPGKPETLGRIFLTGVGMAVMVMICHPTDFSHVQSVRYYSVPGSMLSQAGFLTDISLEFLNSLMIYTRIIIINAQFWAQYVNQWFPISEMQDHGASEGIWGGENCYLLGCDTIKFGKRLPSFRRNVVLSASGSKSKPSMQSRRNIFNGGFQHER